MQQKARVHMCFSILLSDAQKAEKTTHVSLDLEGLVVCNVSSEQQLLRLKTGWQWKSFDVHEERTVVMRQDGEWLSVQAALAEYMQPGTAMIHTRLQCSSGRNQGKSLS